jgi:hypothetical protein
MGAPVRRLRRWADLLDGEVVLVEDGDDAGDLVAGVDDDGFERGLVAEDGAVALQGADGEDFMDHGCKTKGLRPIAADVVEGKLLVVDDWVRA